MAGHNTAEIGFEKEIWDAACVLRGNIDAAEYKHVVLGLIFLKYLSDKFGERYQTLKDEGEGFEEDRDAYAEKQVFYVPVSARWKKIAAKAH
ncbi:MAG: type I restriction-modification system subunit M N-terminal domain-containing protein, partial [Treponema sp.]|nr:type I restriction-modification system subunit M N-terminal domain-containing protein [Treponema sp.]